MPDLLKEVRDFGLFLQMLVYVLVYTGLAVIPIVVLIRTLFQAYLYRNVADRSRQ